MEETKVRVKYGSSIAYMALNLIWASALIALVTLRFLPNALKTGDALLRNGLTAAALAACILYFLLCRFVTVTVDDTEVVVRSPLRRGVRFSRADCVFTSRFHTYAYKNIPLWTNRFLIADDGQSRTEASLPNLTQRTFSLLMAELRKPPVSESADARAITAEFVIPKVGMLAEYRRFMLLVGGAILALMTAQFFVLNSLDSKGSPGENLLLFAVAFCFLELLFGIPMVLSYLGQKRRIPERVTIQNGTLRFDDAAVNLTDIRRIAATPPSYGAEAFGSAREILIETDWERMRYNCGIRSRGRLRKTIFDDYLELCRTLDRTAAASGFSFEYSF